VTTPAQDAPLVFPSVAFRPKRLLIVCVALTAVAVAASAFTGHVLFGVFFGVGLGLGLVNAMLVRKAVESITASDHPLKKKMAVNSAMRLLVITAVALTISIGAKTVFKNNDGLGVLFGLAIFQAVLVMSTSIPVMKKIRSSGLDVAEVPASESKD
jgi:dipeptide/tripeptide permease